MHAAGEIIAAGDRLEVTVVLPRRISRRLLLAVVPPTLQRAVGTKRASVATPSSEADEIARLGSARDLIVEIIAPTVDPSGCKQAAVEAISRGE